MTLGTRMANRVGLDAVKQTWMASGHGALPSVPVLIEAHDTILQVEAHRNIGPLTAEHPEKVSDVMKALLAAGARVSAAQYEEARALQTELSAQSTPFMGGCDVVVSPPATRAAPLGLDYTGDATFLRRVEFSRHARSHDSIGACGEWVVARLPADRRTRRGPARAAKGRLGCSGAAGISLAVHLQKRKPSARHFQTVSKASDTRNKNDCDSSTSDHDGYWPPAVVVEAATMRRP
jgi:hypothetical protein